MFKYFLRTIIFSLVFGFFILSPQISGADSFGNLEIEVHPLAFTAKHRLIVSENNEQFKIPWEWKAISPIYDYTFVSSGFYDPSRPLEIKIHYDEAGGQLKQIFSFDFLSNVWRPVPSIDHPQEKYLSFTSDATSAWLIALTKPETMSVGVASWYKYKEGLFAASPDYPKGTILQVTNLNNNKLVEVVVNDYGPDRSVHPDRIIDLDRVAFEQLAPLSQGIIRSVKVEPVRSQEEERELFAHTLELPEINSASAIIMREDTGAVLFSQNVEQVLPIASLSKLVAIKVFLDTNPDLARIVHYDRNVEAINLYHCECEAWELARLRLKQNDTLSLKDLVYSALVGSANNAVETLLSYSGLSRDEFIKRMNELVKSWGANNTKFVEPTGLSKYNVSTAFDYAIISKEVFKDDLIAKISTTKNYSFSIRNSAESHNLQNTNKLLTNINNYPIIGSKTGFINEAGYCLSTKIQTPLTDVVIIQLNAPDRAQSFTDMETLIRFSNLSLVQ